MAKHIHKYKKVPFGKRKTLIFKCMIPDCTHYVLENMAQGKKSICWACGRVFVMTGDKLRRVKPKCDLCQHRHGTRLRDSGDAEILRDITELLDNL